MRLPLWQSAALCAVDHVLQAADAVLHDHVELLLLLIVQHVNQLDQVPVVERLQETDFPVCARRTAAQVEMVSVWRTVLLTLICS